jgi:hypothetical protein
VVVAAFTTLGLKIKVTKHESNATDSRVPFRGDFEKSNFLD